MLQLYGICSGSFHTLVVLGCRFVSGMRGGNENVSIGLARTGVWSGILLSLWQQCWSSARWRCALPSSQKRCNSPDSPKRDIPFKRRMKFFSEAVWRNAVSKPPTIPPDHAVMRDAAKAQLAAMGDDDFVSWIGHATFWCVQTALTFLPIRCFRAVPAQTLRARPVWYARLLLRLAQVDVVVISHAHYDHLDTATLKNMPNKERITAVVPPDSVNISRVIKMCGKSIGLMMSRFTQWWVQTDGLSGCALVEPIAFRHKSHALVIWLFCRRPFGIPHRRYGDASQPV